MHHNSNIKIYTWPRSTQELASKLIFTLPIPELLSNHANEKISRAATNGSDGANTQQSTSKANNTRLRERAVLQVENLMAELIRSPAPDFYLKKGPLNNTCFGDYLLHEGEIKKYISEPMGLICHSLSRLENPTYKSEPLPKNTLKKLFLHPRSIPSGYMESYLPSPSSVMDACLKVIIRVFGEVYEDISELLFYIIVNRLEFVLPKNRETERVLIQLAAEQLAFLLDIYCHWCSKTDFFLTGSQKAGIKSVNQNTQIPKKSNPKGDKDNHRHDFSRKSSTHTETLEGQMSKLSLETSTHFNHKPSYQSPRLKFDEHKRALTKLPQPNINFIHENSIASRRRSRKAKSWHHPMFFDSLDSVLNEVIFLKGTIKKRNPDTITRNYFKNPNNFDKYYLHAHTPPLYMNSKIDIPTKFSLYSHRNQVMIHYLHNNTYEPVLGAEKLNVFFDIAPMRSILNERINIDIDDIHNTPSFRCIVAKWLSQIFSMCITTHSFKFTSQLAISAISNQFSDPPIRTLNQLNNPDSLLYALCKKSTSHLYCVIPKSSRSSLSFDNIRAAVCYAAEKWPFDLINFILGQSNELKALSAYIAAKNLFPPPFNKDQILHKRYFDFFSYFSVINEQTLLPFTSNRNHEYINSDFTINFIRDPFGILQLLVKLRNYKKRCLTLNYLKQKNMIDFVPNGYKVPLVSIDCEGISLGRQGEMCLMQLAIGEDFTNDINMHTRISFSKIPHEFDLHTLMSFSDSGFPLFLSENPCPLPERDPTDFSAFNESNPWKGTTFIIDMVLMGKRAFEISTPDGYNLKKFFSDGEIFKLFYDARSDVDALHHEFGVNVYPLLDVQIIELATRMKIGVNSKYLRGMNYTTKEYQIFSEEQTHFVENLDLYAKRLYEPRSGGKHIIFKQRPIHPTLLIYAGFDVRQLFPLFEKLKSSLSRDWWSSIELESNRRSNYWKNTAEDLSQIQRAFSPSLIQSELPQSFLVNKILDT